MRFRDWYSLLAGLQSYGCNYEKKLPQWGLDGLKIYWRGNKSWSRNFCKDNLTLSRDTFNPIFTQISHTDLGPDPDPTVVNLQLPTFIFTTCPTFLCCHTGLDISRCRIHFTELCNTELSCRSEVQASNKPAPDFVAVNLFSSQSEQSAAG